MKVPKFNEFITEDKNEKYKVVILTVEFGDKSITAKKFEEEAQKMGMKTFLANFKEVSLKFDNGKHFLSDDKKKIEINKSDTVVFVRGTPSRDSMLDLISELERLGITCINNRTTINVCADKYRSYVRLKDFRLNQPKSVLIPNEDSIETSLKELDTQFPIILKTLRGSKGVGVLFVESERSLHSIVQLIYKNDKDSDIMIQEYIKTPFDVRAIIVGSNIIATMRRDVIEGDFRSNVSQGATPKPYKLSEEEIRQCLIAAKAVDGDFVAVDFIPYKGQPYFLEVNSSPGTDGIEDANSNLNIAKLVLEHYQNPQHRYSVPTKCGYHEMISIKPFGEIEGKFDTGNGVLSVLHAENTKINGKKITFTLNGKTITTNLIKMYKATTGAGVDERPVVELEMEFMGHMYNFMFGLDDRTKMGTDVLLNRFAMKTMNVMVDPQKKFILTTKQGE